MIDQAWSLGAIAGEQVIRAVGCSHCFHRPHGNHVGIVPWGVDGSISRSSEGIVAPVISGSRYHDNTGFPCRFNSLAKGVVLIALINQTTERKVYDTDVVRVFQLNGPAQSGDHTAVRTFTIRIEHAKVDQIDSGSNSFEGPYAVGATGSGSACAYDAGHMLPVTV